MGFNNKLPRRIPSRSQLSGLLEDETSSALYARSFHQSYVLLIMLVPIVLCLGCGSRSTSVNVSPSSTTTLALNSQSIFLNKNIYDPWILTRTDPHEDIQAYLSDGKTGVLINADGTPSSVIRANDYVGGAIKRSAYSPGRTPGAQGYQQQLDMRTGLLTTDFAGNHASYSEPGSKGGFWQRLWLDSDITIEDDPISQQLTHAFLFYTLESIDPTKSFSVAPFGLSSDLYNGHVFWDADTWIMPALLPQFPQYARAIVRYRFAHLKQADKIVNHSTVANYPWESADSGKELAPAEFAAERHINADVAISAWQYYLWTGDSTALNRDIWPLLRDTANYWCSRVTKQRDGAYHILHVLSPDETAGIVDDDAYTNADAKLNLTYAISAAEAVHVMPNPQWKLIASRIYMPWNRALGIPSEYAGVNSDRLQAKQGDLILLLFPLKINMSQQESVRLIAYSKTHTIQNGPAMTSSMTATSEARMGDTTEAYSDYTQSWRPFIRGSFDAFAEKRSSNRTYFITGMCGSLQTILYGFAGLSVNSGPISRMATRIDTVDGVTLSADPHLPAKWKSLTIRGIKFRGNEFDLRMQQGGKIIISRR